MTNRPQSTEIPSSDHQFVEIDGEVVVDPELMLDQHPNPYVAQKITEGYGARELPFIHQRNVVHEPVHQPVIEASPEPVVDGTWTRKFVPKVTRTQGVLAVRKVRTDAPERTPRPLLESAPERSGRPERSTQRDRDTSTYFQNRAQMGARSRSRRA